MRLASKSKEMKGFLFYKKGIVSMIISPVMFYTNSGKRKGKIWKK